MKKLLSLFVALLIIASPITVSAETQPEEPTVVYCVFDENGELSEETPMPCILVPETRVHTEMPE